MVRERKRYHRGRKKKSGAGYVVILTAAIVVFCISAFQIYRILTGYHRGRAEYDRIRKAAVQVIDWKETSDGSGTEYASAWIDFEQLLAINPDTVGWLRFDPEPAQIDYPIVQGPDNDLYLNKTFSANENTVGAIFVNAYNRPDFSDRNTIIYGHRMNDSSMFHDLKKYQDKSFWEANPYFYIYTPDGKELTYHIYSAGVVKDVSDTYLTEFESDEAFQKFLDMTKETSGFDTGVQVDTEDTVVTLSTCTSAGSDDRFVVRGVKEAEKPTRKPE